MTFPLPQGICRKVCRPTRVPPRVIRASEVFRIARAAKRNGESPCSILASAYRALPLDHHVRLTAAARALAESASAVNEATAEVLEGLVTIRGTRVILIWRILALIYDVSMLVSALIDMSDDQMKIIDVAQEVANCLEPTND